MPKKNVLFAVVTGVVILGMVATYSMSPTQTIPSSPTPTPTPTPTQVSAEVSPSPSPTTINSQEKTMEETTPNENSGLKKEVLKQGTGLEAKNGDLVQVHYTGTLQDGKKFDSSIDRGTPFQFKLGSGMVIKGWDLGVAGMKVGEKVKLTIPAELGYGATGYPPVIPQNATLIFEVELLKIN